MRERVAARPCLLRTRNGKITAGAVGAGGVVAAGLYSRRSSGATGPGPDPAAAAPMFAGAAGGSAYDGTLAGAGGYAKDDGYTYNRVTGHDLNAADHWAGRLSLLYTPSTDFELLTQVNRYVNRGDATAPRRPAGKAPVLEDPVGVADPRHERAQLIARVRGQDHGIPADGGIDAFGQPAEAIGERRADARAERGAVHGPRGDGRGSRDGGVDPTDRQGKRQRQLVQLVVVDRVRAAVERVAPVADPDLGGRRRHLDAPLPSPARHLERWVIGRHDDHAGHAVDRAAQGARLLDATLAAARRVRDQRDGAGQERLAGQRRQPRVSLAWAQAVEIELDHRASARLGRRCRQRAPTALRRADHHDQAGVVVQRARELRLDRGVRGVDAQHRGHPDEPPRLVHQRLALVAIEQRGHGRSQTVDFDGWADFGHDLPATPAEPARAKEARLFARASRRGPRRAGRGWAASPGAPVSSWRMTSDQAPVYWPFIAGPGLPPTGAQPAAGMAVNIEGFGQVAPMAAPPPMAAPTPAAPPPVAAPPPASGGDNDEEIRRLRRRIDQLQAELRVYRGGKVGQDKARRMEDLENDLSNAEVERDRFKQRVGELEGTLKAESGNAKVQRAVEIRGKRYSPPEISARVLGKLKRAADMLQLAPLLERGFFA